jgi:hypothetical protein
VSEMVERVARAIYESTQGKWTGVPWAEADRGEHLRQARAAIEAMREPTEGMLDAGPPEPYMDRWVWAKMIFAALYPDMALEDEKP